MSRFSKILGMVLLGAGLAAVVGFSTFALRDERFDKAALLRDRNPGNVMYEGQYFAAFTLHVFLIAGAVCGALLAINGTTLLLVGRLAARQVASEPPRGDT